MDLGSHQIDIYAWFLNALPKGVMASGGTDYYDKNTHEWYDTVMTIFDFETKEGMVRAYYQVLTTNSNQGYSETFMGDQGTLAISESSARGSVYREQSAQVDWDKWVKLGFVNEPKKEEPKKADCHGGPGCSGNGRAAGLRDPRDHGRQGRTISRTWRTSSTPCAAKRSSTARARSDTRPP